MVETATWKMKKSVDISPFEFSRRNEDIGNHFVVFVASSLLVRNLVYSLSLNVQDVSAV